MKRFIPANIKPVYTWIFVIVLSVGIGLQNYFLGPKDYGNGVFYTYYNNYRIFADSFFHLVHGQDLYQYWPAEHWDLYKYSPSFALLMAPFAKLPDVIGLSLWNVLNIAVFVFALRKMAISGTKGFIMMLGIVVVELVTCTQNAQVNAMIAGMLMYAFVAMENRKPGVAALLIVGTAFIKIFGIVALLLFLFYPNKLKSAMYVALWTVVLLLIPLIVVSPEQLIFLYKSWGSLLIDDHSVSQGISVSGFLQAVSGAEISKNAVLFAGMLLLLLPLVRLKRYGDFRFRLFYFVSILIWIVIFNHKAESPTFIIAMAGIALWAVPLKENILDNCLLLLAVILTGFSASDLFPKFLRDTYIVPYSLKALPCLLIWLRITVSLLFEKPEPGDELSAIAD